MSLSVDINCPVSQERINENVVRAVALQVLILAALSLYLNSFYLSGFLAFDFAIRSFTKGEWSILRLIALQINRALKIKPVLIDAAPKKFAAGVGIVFSIAIAIFQYIQLPVATYVVGTVLLICAFLEGLVGFCVGCVVYTFVVQPLINLKK